jgi:hypothetical protein
MLPFLLPLASAATLASAFSCSANRSTLLGLLLLVQMFFDNFAVSFHDDSILTRRSFNAQRHRQPR